MNASGRFVALLAFFLTLHLGGASQTAPQIQSTAPDKVVFSTTVINKKGEFVTGLQRANFQISIDKKPAKIIDFREEDVPLSVGLVFDASGSVTRDRSSKATRALIYSAQQAIKGFLEMSNPSNEYFLMAFSDRSQPLLDWTSDAQAIIDTLRILQAKGNTALYDACYLALDKVRTGRYSKRVLILITDGKDNNSTHSFEQVRDELRASEVLVYSVNFLGPGTGGISDMEGQNILDEFSLVSGGVSFYKRSAKTSEAVSVFEMIASELRRQYTVTVRPDLAFANSKWHKIKVRVEAATNAPDEMKHLSARTREGFYFNRR